MHEFKYEELVQATESFSQSRLVGKGSHGCVYRGILMRNGCDHDQLVAVKKQSLGLQKLRDNSKLENEVRILSSLSHNPYLINLLGISHDSSNNKVLVMEYMPNGTLHEMLHGPVGVSSTPPPTWPKRAQIALQIAKAAQFLHEARPPIVHRDIKSANILFDSDWNAKLADLGLGIRMNPDSLDRQIDSLNRPAGTIGYLDPAYTAPSKLSTKIDVFSFGVLLLEIISGRKVMDVSRSPSSIVEWAIPLIQKDQILEISDRRVPISRFTEGLIRNMLSIATRCINSRETDRPSMGEIVRELQNCIVEPIRYPVWMNLLRSLIQRKIGTSKNKTTARAAASTIVCAPRQENGHANISRGKLLLREILADIS